MKTAHRFTLVVIVCSIAAFNASATHVTGPITDGSEGGPFCAPTIDVSELGYVVEEYFIEGDAHGYAFKDGTSQTEDGEWATEQREDTAPYRTRILVVRPESNDDFNGTVIVHWQNVTAGYELGSVSEGEYLRGFAWVGVSAQKIGIDGFPGPEAAGLKQWDEERYGSLEHPGDGYSYDIFTQAAREVGPDRPKRDPDPMGGLDVKRLVGAGASQSAMRLRTYIDGVHPVEKVFDGFIPYIDFGSTLPFDNDFSDQPSRQRNSTRIREDLNVPVFVVNSETETRFFSAVRQPDTPTFRFWEVAGTSHVSVPRGEKRDDLDSPNWLSFMPVYYAAIRHMHDWLTDGTEPPKMPPIEVNDSGEIQRDKDGNAKGGIRLPDMEAPTAMHSGRGKMVAGGSRFGFLYGTAEDFSAEKLKELYPTQEAFIEQYDKALKKCVDEGTVLAEDAPTLLDSARAWSVCLK